MNEVTREAYVEDCNIGLKKRWNRLIKNMAIPIYTNSFLQQSLDEILVFGLTYQ